jgi:transposase
MIGGLSHPAVIGGLVPALPSSVLEPLWVQMAALLPARQNTHPLGCHRPRIPDRIVFDKLIQVLVFGCGYRRIADASCSATTLRRRDEWIALGLAEQLRLLVLGAYDRLLGLESEHLVVDGCITNAPCGGQVAGPGPVDRRKPGLKHLVAVEMGGIPLRCCPPRPTTVTTGCWPRPWTPSMWWGRCLLGR